MVPIWRGRADVIRALAEMRLLVTHAHLKEGWGIPRALLEQPRFAGRLLVDARSNVIFLHAAQDGPRGYEINNRGFTGFAPGGETGLWFSAARVGDTALVITESDIDTVSHAALHPDENARYASTGGAMNPTQPAMIRGAIEKMGQGAAVIIATDNDVGGRQLAEQIAVIAEEIGRADIQNRPGPARRGGE